MIETDLPELAALAEVDPPPADSAGARFLRAATDAGPAGAPQADADVWQAWVDLGLWRGATVAGPVDLTAHARADLAALAARLREASVPEGERTGLTGEQDARLRTLAALRELGELSPALQQVRRSYRERDQRADVRPPAQVTWPVPEPADPA